MTDPYSFQAVIAWIGAPGVRVLLMLAVAILIKMGVDASIERVIRKLVKPDTYATAEAEKKREDTLIKVFKATFGVIFWLVIIMILLSEFGVNIGPLIAGAGIVGVAVGFGGQWLIRDVISGLFIILENQYRVGDVIRAADVSGLVEDINLRLTVLRDMDGTVHYIPNGEIKVSSNLSKDFARVNLDIGVAYDADMEKVIKTINAVGTTLAKDRVFKAHIKKAPEFLRVEEFADSAVVVKVLGDVAPLKQWEVAGEFRRRLKEAFDQEGIEIPFPQRVIWMKGGEQSDV